MNIEGGRPAKVGSFKAEVPDRSIIGDGCWINHGATMHGTHIDYVIPDNSFAEGVPAVVKKKNITEEDRLNYFGLEIDPDFLLDQHSLLTLMS